MLNKIKKINFNRILPNYTKNYIGRKNYIVSLTKNGLEFDNEYFVSHQESRLNCRCLRCWYKFNQTRNVDLAENVSIEEITEIDDKYIHLKWVRTVFRILIQLYVSIKMKENESKSK
jgi:hypothetical protein